MTIRPSVRSPLQHSNSIRARLHVRITHHSTSLPRSTTTVCVLLASATHVYHIQQVGLSVCVQKMVRADLASSGVIFSLDTESGFENVVFVTGAWGLGENIVQGNVNPDEFYIFKPTLDQPGCRPIIRRKLGAKQVRRPNVCRVDCLEVVFAASLLVTRYIHYHSTTIT